MQKMPAKKPQITGALTGGSELIFLVEDEKSVRNLAAHILREKGYNVLEASNGYEALKMVQTQTGQQIDLLITDVVMPQLGGSDLAEWFKANRPDTKILFMSGYTDSVTVRHGLSQQDSVILLKPFTPNSLSRIVREVLDTP